MNDFEPEGWVSVFILCAIVAAIVTKELVMRGYL